MRQPRSGAEKSNKYDLRPRFRSEPSSSSAGIDSLKTKDVGNGCEEPNDVVADSVSSRKQTSAPFIKSSEMVELKNELNDLALELLELETKCTETLILDTDKNCVASAFLAESQTPWKSDPESLSPSAIRVATERSDDYSPLDLGLDVDFFIDPSPLPNLVESEIETALRHVSCDIGQALADVDPSLEVLDAFLSSLNELQGLESQQNIALPVSCDDSPSLAIEAGDGVPISATKEFVQLETISPDRLASNKVDVGHASIRRLGPATPQLGNDESNVLRVAQSARAPFFPEATASKTFVASMPSVDQTSQALQIAQVSSAPNPIQIAYYSFTHPVTTPYCPASNVWPAQQVLLPQVQQALILPQSSSYVASADSYPMTWPVSTTIQPIPVAVPVQISGTNLPLSIGCRDQAGGKPLPRRTERPIRICQAKPIASVVASFPPLENCPRYCSFSKCNSDNCSVVTIAGSRVRKRVAEAVDLTLDVDPTLDNRKTSSSSKTPHQKTSVSVDDSSSRKIDAKKMRKVVQSSPAAAVFETEAVREKASGEAVKRPAVDSCNSKLCPSSVMIKLPKLASYHDKPVEQQNAIRKRRRRRRHRIEEMSSRLAFRLARYSEDRVTDNSTDEESRVSAICMSRRASNPASCTDADE
ncbi:hypothetical protein CRV168 [Nile crocodilepox virus]|uniref:Uncharacterized protein n=1 Tax=Nile crocodilepox virus (isolate Crocodylus niloticus/Zimbabwe/Ume/2001) TaxID=1289473 RepID=Q06ZY3_CPRVZ|nr:hypothetical protein CRV168 [Nile crocodilepox virus]ABJ09059.1 hypothetical protein CRV168 [Nile crocodilepox virus]